MNARKIILKELKAAGYIFARHGGNHDVYHNPENGHMITIKNSFTEKDLVYIRAEIKRYARENRGGNKGD